MGPALQKMQDDDTANPAMLFVQSGAAAWTEKAGAGGQGLRRLPWRRRRQHEGRGGALSGHCARRRQAGRSRGPDQSLPHDPSAGAGLAAESDELLALGAYVALQSRGLPIAPPDDAEARRRARGRAPTSTSAGRASSISPAPTAMTTMPAGSLPARRSRRPIRPAIRSIGWSGRRWVRSGGGCATASSACAPSRGTGRAEYLALESLFDGSCARHGHGCARRTTLTIDR